MTKRIIAVLLCVLTAIAAVGCSCAGNTPAEVTHQTKEITPDIEINEYAAFATADKWVNDDGDYFVFGHDGKYEGNVSGKAYSGSYDLRIADPEQGLIVVTATPTGADKPSEYTMMFTTSTEMKLTLSMGSVTANFVAEWTTK